MLSRDSVAASDLIDGWVELVPIPADVRDSGRVRVGAGMRMLPTHSDAVADSDHHACDDQIHARPNPDWPGLARAECNTIVILMSPIQKLAVLLTTDAR